MKKNVAGPVAALVALGLSSFAVVPAASAATGTDQTCTDVTIHHDAVTHQETEDVPAVTTTVHHDAVTHEEFRYAESVAGSAAVTHTEYRFRTRTALYGSEEIKKILGWNFVDGSTTHVNGQTVAGHWVQADPSTWYTIPAVIINIVWGPSGVPASYLGKGTVPLSSYGGPSVTVQYDAEKVQTDASYTDWGPWSDWSPQSPGATSNTMDVANQLVTDAPAVPASSVYYLPGGGTSATLSDVNWTTATLAAPWTLADEQTVTDQAAYDETLVLEPATTTTVTITDTPASDEVVRQCTPNPPAETTAPDDGSMPDTTPAQPEVRTAAVVHCGAMTSRITLRVRADGSVRRTAVGTRITISGLPVGRSLSGTATLYGPSATKAVSLAGPQVGTVGFTGHNGTLRTARLGVQQPGYYAWALRSGGKSERCHLGPRSLLARRPAPDVTHIATGFDGQVPVAARRSLSTVSIPALGIDTAFHGVGASAGSMDVPDDVHTVGWLTESAAPGDLIGTTVIAGHVSDDTDQPGAFWNLHRAKRGQIVSVTTDGVTHRFRITSTMTYSRATRLPKSLLSTTGRHRLVLVTCAGREDLGGGHFHYAKNLVVIATPIV